ncbi:TonB-dependent receptor [Hoeflea sp.]|uniref:TonB-dependent receptor domain-containing protein n=1 Tax=Hoeflea sp. TaxID=1940281 RepID=UPI0025C19AC8|nr:TonB-dependent receptor [Hoeflea sp.]
MPGGKCAGCTGGHLSVIIASAIADRGPSAAYGGCHMVASLCRDSLARRVLLGRLAWGTALSGLAMLPCAPAQAQTTATGQPAVEEEAEAEAEAIIVTGSRIVGTGFNSSTPLTVMSAEEIASQSPTNNIADLVNQLPALAGSLRPSNSRLAISSGLSGINALNLRNLGEIRTLVLFDGRRSVGSSVTGLVDINTFPQQLVSRIEVVTGGASAAYGSDAVAGVVNFVLDKRFDGFKFSADSGISSRGDGGNYSFSAAGGLPFADDRGHILLSGELAHSDGIFQVDRDWNFGGERIVNNPAYSAGNGEPQFIVRAPGGTNNALPGGIINASAGGVPNQLRGIYFGPGGSINRYDYGTISTTTTTIGGDYALADNGRNIGLASEEDRRNVYGRFSYDLAPWATFFAEASYSWQETLFNAGPQLGTARVLSGSNPFVVDTLGPLAAGITSITVGTTQSDLPYRKLNNERDVQRYAAGFEGEFEAFGNAAVWDAYVQYGETNAHEQLRDIIINANYANAIDAVAVPAGNALGVPAGTIVCRSTLSAPGNGCVPLNILGTGVTDPAAADYVLGDPYRDQTLKQTVAGVNLSLTPFATWAGDVGVAVGAEYRKEEVSGFVPEEYQTGFSVGNYLPTFGDYNVKEAYLEANVPLGFGLNVNGAVRATDYSTSGYVTTWKAGAFWQPIEDIALRITRSRDIRAPNLNELFQSGTSRTNTLTDPFTNRTGVTFFEVTTGNTELDPEKADSIVVGGVLQPRFIPGLSFAVDYYEVEVEDAIAQFFAQDIINRCFEGFTDFCAGYGPDPTGVRELTFRASPFNFASIKSRGIDFDLAFQLSLVDLLDLPGASLTLRGLASHYLENVVDNGISTPVDTVGSNAGAGPPDWIYRFSATFDTPGFTLTGVGRGISDGTYTNTYYECTSACPPSTTLARTIDDNSVPGTFYVDLNAAVKVPAFTDGEAEVFLHVTNLFDADPLLLPESGLAANSTYSDLIGRAYRVGVRLDF